LNSRMAQRTQGYEAAWCLLFFWQHELSQFPPSSPASSLHPPSNLTSHSTPPPAPKPLRPPNDPFPWPWGVSGVNENRFTCNPHPTCRFKHTELMTSPPFSLSRHPSCAWIDPPPRGGLPALGTWGRLCLQPSGRGHSSPLGEDRAADSSHFVAVCRLTVLSLIEKSKSSRQREEKTGGKNTLDPSLLPLLPATRRMDSFSREKYHHRFPIDVASAASAPEASGGWRSAAGWGDLTHQRGGVPVLPQGPPSLAAAAAAAAPVGRRGTGRGLSSRCGWSASSPWARSCTPPLTGSPWRCAGRATSGAPLTARQRGGGFGSHHCPPPRPPRHLPRYILLALIPHPVGWRARGPWLPPRRRPSGRR